jgi:excisionase family DNA binding protein
MGIRRSATNLRPRMLTTREAAALLNVSQRTVNNWIHQGSIPYVELPHGEGGRPEYRIPELALLRSLAGNYDLAAELKELDDAVEASEFRDGELEPSDNSH